MTDAIKAVIVSMTDETGEREPTLAGVELRKGDTLRALQTAVDGLVDCFDVVHPETGSIATVWFNDEGKLIGMPRNEVAEIIATFGGWGGRAWGDWIAGPVVLTGFDPESGETLELPGEWAEVIVKACIAYDLSGGAR